MLYILKAMITYSFTMQVDSSDSVTTVPDSAMTKVGFKMSVENKQQCPRLWGIR